MSSTESGSSRAAERRPSLAAALLVVCALGVPPSAALGQAAPPPADWDSALLLQGGGNFNPLMLVGLGPQPEPPDHPPEPGLSLADPNAPLLVTPSGGEADFRILFSLSIADGPLVFAPGPDPDANGHYEMQALNALGSALFNISMDITTSSQGVPAPGTWRGFNPQPEPPAFPGHPPDPGAIGFDFVFTSLSEAFLRIQVSEVGGAAIAFARVPEPTVAALAALGVLLLGATGTRRQG